MRKTPLKYHDDTIARIVSSVDGGPFRRIINGRSRRPTGTYVSIKAGLRAMPWESRSCELFAMQIAEVSTSVHSFLAQPHRLELRVRSSERPLFYYPDMQAEVAEEVVQKLIRGDPFGPALMADSAACMWSGATRTVVVEFKSDNDRRMQDAEYLRKLCLAKSVYQKLGIAFVVASDAADLRSADPHTVKEISLDRFTAVSTVDADRAVRCVEGHGGVTSLGELVNSLGGSHVGRAKVHALHVRRIIAIDLSARLKAESSVRLVRGRFHRGAWVDASPSSH